MVACKVGGYLVRVQVQSALCPWEGQPNNLEEEERSKVLCAQLSPDAEMHTVPLGPCLLQEPASLGTRGTGVPVVADSASSGAGAE